MTPLLTLDLEVCTLFSKIMPNFCRPHSRAISLYYIYFIDEIKLTVSPELETPQPT